MNMSELDRFKKQMDEMVKEKTWDKLIQRVADHKRDCDVDNVWVKNSKDRLAEFKKYATDEILKLEKEVARMTEDHKVWTAIYEYGKSLLGILNPKTNKPLTETPLKKKDVKETPLPTPILEPKVEPKPVTLAPTDEELALLEKIEKLKQKRSGKK